MAAFHGFSTENLVPLPAEFFSDVLPSISNLAELKVTLHIFWLVSQQRGRAKRVSWDALCNDPVLAQALRSVSQLRPTSDVLEEALGLAVERSTLLHLISPEPGRVVSWYLINTQANRHWVERQAGQRVLAPEASPAAQPTIFGLYEKNIGLLTPLLIEQLHEASAKYPAEWLAEAITKAVEANVRNWRYIRRILERWETDGKESTSHRSEQLFDLSKYTTGKYAALFGRSGDSDGGDLSDL